MEENKSYDDIILEKDNKSEKIKKILLRIIALIILFLIVIIAMKLINSDETTDTAQEQGIFPSENEFENVAVANSATEDSEFAALRAQLQGLEVNTSATNQTNTIAQMPLPQEPNSNNEVKENTENVVEKAPEQEIQKPKQEVQKPKVETKAEARVETKKEEKPKVEVKKEEKPKQTQKPKEESKPTQELFAEVKTSTQDSLVAGTYIQIFSVSKFDPKSRELAVIGQNGYEYKVYKSKANDKEVTRVLVGPFSKDTINAELAKVREKIRKEAFIFQVK